MSELRLVALDPDTKHVGVATFHEGQPVQAYTIPMHTDRPLVALAAMVSSHVGYWGTLACEMPVVYRNVATALRLAEQIGVIRYACEEADKRFIEVHPGERLVALGLPLMIRRETAKAAVLRTVTQLFPYLGDIDDHAADAVAVGLAALRKLKLEDYANAPTAK